MYLLFETMKCRARKMKLFSIVIHWSGREPLLSGVETIGTYAYERRYNRDSVQDKKINVGGSFDRRYRSSRSQHAVLDGIQHDSVDNVIHPIAKTVAQ